MSIEPLTVDKTGAEDDELSCHTTQPVWSTQFFFLFHENQNQNVIYTKCALLFASAPPLAAKRGISRRKKKLFVIL
jgi:hypothetical protein